MSLNETSLKNTYFALRHGHSVPNEKKIIISDPSLGTQSEHGLTEKGRDQVRLSIQQALEKNLLPENGKGIVIISSPFSRTVGSTKTAWQVIPDIERIHVHHSLRERYFGDFDQKSNEHYQDVWDIDAHNPHHKTYNVESVMSVLQREEDVIRILENAYREMLIVLSGHGDPLQILETSFRGIDPSQHRSLPPLENGELRLLNKR